MYVFKPKGICPKEIHFSLQDNLRFEHLRLVGGGCPGNGELVSRLLEGRSIDEVLPHLEGIVCRNGTSCADQLSQALLMVKNGQLQEADPITIMAEERPNLGKLAAIAEIRGNLPGLKSVLAAAQAAGAEAVYSLGNLVWPQGDNDAVVELAAKQGLRNVQSPGDRQAAHGLLRNQAGPEALHPQNRDRLLLDPLIRTFQLGQRRAVAFHGGFIQDLYGFSDFSPYATEIIMTCNLSDYLRDETVFPALATMTEQFAADLVLFGYTGKWKHLRLGKVDFINVGPLVSSEGIGYGLLEWQDDGLKVQFRTIPLEAIRS
jgi:uncharacterized protein (TIGR03905 family)